VRDDVPDNTNWVGFKLGDRQPDRQIGFAANALAVADA
jgi:hypothetical protein